MDGKLYLFVDEDSGCTQRLILVKNFDENFTALLTHLHYEWIKTDEEYFEFVFRGLKKAGYEFEELDFEVFMD